MKKLSKKMSLKEFALAVAETLKKNDIQVILTGGAVVSIYSDGKYVLPSITGKIVKVLSKLSW